MSLARSVTALYASQAYSVAVGIVVTPIFLRLLGAEGYGLVGVYMLLQAWLQALDFGAPVLLTRQVARWRAGIAQAHELRSALRLLEILFFTVGALAVLVMSASAERVAVGWLKVHELSNDAVRHALLTMAVACGLRWMSSPYRAAVVGLEQLGWLACIGALFTTLRFVVVLPWILYADRPVESFFVAQVALGLAELCVLAARAYRHLPSGLAGDWRDGLNALGDGGRALGWSMAAATGVWLLTTQVDRLILSKVLTLADYGYFTLAMTVAGAILQVAAPLVQGFVPRLTYLSAAGREDELRAAYERLTQWVVALVACLATVVAVHAEAVVFVWTGNAVVAAAVAPALAAYATAQALLAITTLPYNLQLARGDLRLHLLGTSLMLVLLVPLAIWAAARWGALGAGCVWVGVLTTYLALWAPIAHRRHAPGLHGRWLYEGVLKPAFPAIGVGILSALAASRWPSGRLSLAVLLLCTTAGAGLATVWWVPSCRRALLDAVAAWRAPRAGH
jgi:O-antigen/teichoic acid export membrane protein